MKSKMLAYTTPYKIHLQKIFLLKNSFLGPVL